MTFIRMRSEKPKECNELSSRPGMKPGIKPLIFLLTKFLGGIFFTFFYRIQKEGIEHLPRQEAFILLPKHQCWVDIPLIGWVTPRTLYYMAKYELFTNPLIGWYLSALGGLPINRRKPLFSRFSLNRMMDYLEQGAGIVIFPEGTYYPDRMGTARAGLIKMIRSRVNVPFVPVGIRYWKGRGRGLLKIKYGRPLEPDPGLATEDFLAQVMQEIALLSEL